MSSVKLLFEFTKTFQEIYRLSMNFQRNEIDSMTYSEQAVNRHFSIYWYSKKRVQIYWQNFLVCGSDLFSLNIILNAPESYYSQNSKYLSKKASREGCRTKEKLQIIDCWGSLRCLYPTSNGKESIWWNVHNVIYTLLLSASYKSVKQFTPGM